MPEFRIDRSIGTPVSPEIEERNKLTKAPEVPKDSAQGDTFFAEPPSAQHIEPKASQVESKSIGQQIIDKQKDVEKLAEKALNKSENAASLEAIDKKIAKLKDSQVELANIEEKLGSRRISSSTRKSLEEQRNLLSEFLNQLQPLQETRETLAAEIKSAEQSNLDTDLKKAKEELSTLKKTRQDILQATLETPEGAKAAAKLVAARKGQLTRRQTVLASEIKTYLEEANLTKSFTDTFGTKINLDALSKALSRQILSYVQKPESLDYTGKKIVPRNQPYSFPTFDKNGNYLGKEIIKLPTDLIARKSKDGKSIELEMVGQEIGKGGFKTVYQSRPLEIRLDSADHPKTMQDTVLVHAKPDRTNFVLDGMKAIKDNFTAKELANPALKLAGILTQTDRSIDGELAGRDVEYRGDLFQFKAEPGSQAKMEKVLADAAKTLQLIHQKGLVHSDIKPENILVTKGDKPRGFISDFDGLVKQGSSVIVSTPGYEDATANKLEVATPFTDIYALAKTVEESLGQPQRPDIQAAYKEVYKKNTELERFLLTTKEGKAMQKKLANPKTTQSAIADLNQRFPAFQNFLTLMAKQ